MKLLASEPEEIPEILRQYDEEQENIIKEISDIVYYIGGGLSWQEAWKMSTKEREYLVESLKENMEKTYGKKE